MKTAKQHNKNQEGTSLSVDDNLLIYYLADNKKQAFNTKHEEYLNATQVALRCSKALVNMHFDCLGSSAYQRSWTSGENKDLC